MNYAGRNGLGLLVLTLAWWGQMIWNDGVVEGIGGGEAVLARNTEWNFMVEDLAWALNLLAEAKDRLAVEAYVAEQEADEAADTVLGKGKDRGKKGNKSGTKAQKRKGKHAAEILDSAEVLYSLGEPILVDATVTNANGEATADSEGDKAGVSDAMTINGTAPSKSNDDPLAEADSAQGSSNTSPAPHTLALSPTTGAATTTSESLERTEAKPFADLMPEELAKMELDPDAEL
ncbi:hypothetical protein C8R45DRAFT_1115862 [Mycena sanguinolenta]|nr:hypothetical protein C8R45DRAFT_1115862 [Mycena sanguinolenta]